MFIDEVEKANEKSHWEIDSAAIASTHVGHNPNHRALLTMRKHDLSYKKRARQIIKADFKYFDYILGMDEKNIQDLRRLCPKDGTPKIMLLGDFDPLGERIIKDPYFVSMQMDIYI